MKKIFLLPRGCQTIGWAILIPSLLLGGSILLNLPSWDMSDSMQHLINNIALIGTAAGLILTGFARERHEDEMITSLRLNSLLSAVYINYIVLVVLALFFYDLAFLNWMFILLFTIPMIHLVLFRIAMYRLNKSAENEE